MKVFFLLSLCLFLAETSLAQCPTKVQYAGTMRETLKNGKTGSVLSLDTIDSNGLIGIGPLEKLGGEITVLNGEIYLSVIDVAEQSHVSKVDKAGSPFIVYANINAWANIKTYSARSIADVDSVLNSLAHENCAFPFLIKGKFEKIKYHVLKGPGSKVYLENENIEGTLVGFFSKNHKGVFTHHDSNIHVHFLSDDKMFMGHVDDVKFRFDSVRWQIPDEHE